MLQSFADLARLPVLPTLVALIAGFTVFLTGFRLAARARETSIEGRAGWLFLAAIASGGGLWALLTLLLTTVAAPAELKMSLLLSALFLAIATAFAAFLLQGRRGDPLRAAAAGLMTAVGAVTVSAIGLESLALAPAVSAAVPDAASALVLLTAAGALAHRVAAGGSARSSEWAAGLLAPAVVLAGLLVMTSPDGAGGFRLGEGEGTIGAWSATLMVAIVLFLVIGSGMATALIDRDAQFASHARLKRLADAAVEGLVILDGNRVVEVNEAFAALVERRREDLAGALLPGNLLHIDPPPPDQPPGRRAEGHAQAADGRLIPVEVVERPIELDGRPHRIVAVRDLTDHRDAELRIRFLADHDIVTGLANRAAFQRDLQRRCEALADGGQRFALFCLDLDRFKEANDAFGQSAGDRLLAEAGERIRAALPADAFAARIGGDEFVALVPDGGSAHALGIVADRAVAALSEPFDLDGRSLRLGACVGIAVAPVDGEAADLLLARAGIALERAKAGGEGAVRFFEGAMDEETRRRRALAFDLRSAIEAGELQLLYQPLADLGTSGITGFEALVRWEHPVHGTIAPAIFVTIAEECGLIGRIGEWVLRAAVAEAATWTRPLRVAVNVAPAQLEDPDLPDLVREALVSASLSPARLELEVTEAGLARNPQRALDVLRRIKALGVRIAMDDFGTGHSSLSTLRAFPFDKLKIDRSFVDRVGLHDQAASMVRGVLGLSRSLDIRVVAEGVETEAQMLFLSGEACDEVQGFMIGLPRPIADYAHLTRPAPHPPGAGGEVRRRA